MICAPRLLARVCGRVNQVRFTGKALDCLLYYTGQEACRRAGDELGRPSVADKVFCRYGKPPEVARAFRASARLRL
jgi:hypothetical protein